MTDPFLGFLDHLQVLVLLCPGCHGVLVHTLPLLQACVPIDAAEVQVQKQETDICFTLLLGQCF